MSLGLRSYRLATSLVEPFAGLLLQQRVSRGKERRERLPERHGRSSLNRPAGRLVWLHGASVGETALLISLFQRLRTKLPDVIGLFTSQTLTSADMLKQRALDGVIHQMAPIDGPGAVKRFMAHWKPDAGVFAEGELWPNLLHQARETGVPMALVNARMTAKTLRNWYARPVASRQIFDTFEFIGAADEKTAMGLRRASGRLITTVGNLKQAIDAPHGDEDQLTQWRKALAERPVLLAASTHAGEEAFAAKAFAPLIARGLNPLLIVAPRHPDRAPQAAEALAAAGLTFKQRSVDPSIGCEAQVLLADTIGEMGLWMRLAQAVYLGGANKPDVGGHNPIEPLKLKKPVFTGPHHFNFDDLMDRLELFGGVRISDKADDLEHFFSGALDKTTPPPDWRGIDGVFADVERPLTETITAITSMLSSGEHA